MGGEVSRVTGLVVQLVVGTLAWMMVDVQRASRQRRELYRLYRYVYVSRECWNWKREGFPPSPPSPPTPIPLQVVLVLFLPVVFH